MTQSPFSGKPLKRVLIVGGGTAGWLSACHIARKLATGADGVDVRLLESKDIPTIGVGEGTVPAIRQSLQRLGISETEFIRECDATFKQSIKFVDWMKPAGDRDYYHHIFDYPGIDRVDLTPYWLMGEAEGCDYVDAVSVQGRVCENGLGPKLMTHPEFIGATNYAYHLDAAKFAALLTRHATGKLGVRHVLGNMLEVRLAPDGSIRSVVTDEHGELEADLYVDCTGFSSRLLGEALDVGFISKNDVLFVDNALAIQVPYGDERTPIPCHTIATAQDCGWVWDIGLHERRGTGYVYSEKYCSHDRAEAVFRDYLRGTVGDLADELPARRIPMQVGYRETFWVRNCVAIGLAQGFVEPLEATGLLVFDATARMLAELFPPSTGSMPAIAERFNERVRYAWDRVIDFIKLHYYLSDRDDSDFWTDNRNPLTAPDSLLKNLALWREQPPTEYDFFSRQEIFKLENYLYVLYGMRFPTDVEPIRYRYRDREAARREFERIGSKAERTIRELLPHRELIDRIKTYGLQKV